MSLPSWEEEEDRGAEEESAEEARDAAATDPCSAPQAAPAAAWEGGLRARLQHASVPLIAAL